MFHQKESKRFFHKSNWIIIQINNTKEALNQTSISLKEYSDDLVKLYIRSIKVTNKGNLIIQFKSGLEMTVSCKCTLASWRQINLICHFSNSIEFFFGTIGKVIKPIQSFISKCIKWLIYYSINRWENEWLIMSFCYCRKGNKYEKAFLSTISYRLLQS